MDTQVSKHQILWKDRKRHLGLPLSFTKYTLRDDKFIIERGFFNLVTDEVRLYRILDLQTNRPLGQRIFGVGTIAVHSSDKSLKDFNIEKIKNPKAFAELLSEQVESERVRKRISGREFIGDSDDVVEDDDIV